MKKPEGFIPFGCRRVEAAEASYQKDLALFAKIDAVLEEDQVNFAVDIDNVVADWADALNQWMFKNHGIAVESWTAWDWHGPEELFKAFWADQKAMIEVYNHCLPVDGAISGVMALSKLGRGRITYVTHRNAWASDVTHEWLFRMGISHPVVFLAGKRKERHFNADFWIDDKPQNVEQLLGDGQRAFLFDRTHNRVSGAHLPRLTGWTEVVNAARKCTIATSVRDTFATGSARRAR